MNSNKRKSKSKYTIGPHGEIYNNNPQLSEKTQNMLKALMIEDVIKSAMEETEDEDTTASETGNDPVCDKV